MSNCNADCNCNDVPYNPVCSNEDGFTNFFSPCHAGCKGYEQDENGTLTAYTDCACLLTASKRIPAPSVLTENLQSFQNGTVSSGVCPVDCQSQFFGLLVFLVIFSIVGSTTRIPNFLLSLRSIEMRDKSASITFTISFLSLFAFLPSPIFYGALLDTTCSLWDVTKCGETTHCLVYDTDAMRSYLAFIPAAFIFLALLADVGVFYYSKGMVVYDEESTNQETATTKDDQELKEKGFKEIDLNA